MKKLFLCLLVLFLSFTIVGCGGKKESTANPSKPDSVSSSNQGNSGLDTAAYIKAFHEVMDSAVALANDDIVFDTAVFGMKLKDLAAGKIEVLDDVNNRRREYLKQIEEILLYCDNNPNFGIPKVQSAAINFGNLLSTEITDIDGAKNFIEKHDALRNEYRSAYSDFLKDFGSHTDLYELYLNLELGLSPEDVASKAVDLPGRPVSDFEFGKNPSSTQSKREPVEIPWKSGSVATAEAETNTVVEQPAIENADPNAILDCTNDIFFIDESILGMSFDKVNALFGGNFPEMQVWEWGTYDKFFDYNVGDNQYTFFFKNNVLKGLRYEIVANGNDMTQVDVYKSKFGNPTTRSDGNGYRFNLSKGYLEVFLNPYDGVNHIAMHYGID